MLLLPRSQQHWFHWKIRWHCSCHKAGPAISTISRPVSSRNSLAAASFGVSPLSINPAGKLYTHSRPTCGTPYLRIFFTAGICHNNYNAVCMRLCKSSVSLNPLISADNLIDLFPVDPAFTLYRSINAPSCTFTILSKSHISCQILFLIRSSTCFINKQCAAHSRCHPLQRKKPKLSDNVEAFLQIPSLDCVANASISTDSRFS